jgi:hypothetical protein
MAHFFRSSSLSEKNNLYAHNIHTITPAIIIRGVITFTILLKTKLLIESHHHSVDPGSAASKCDLIGSIALSIDESNLDILSTRKEKPVELLSTWLSFPLKEEEVFTLHSICTSL